jgi:hypothetical protein
VAATNWPTGVVVTGPLTLLTLGMTPEDARRLAHIPQAARFRFQPLGEAAAADDPEACHPRAFLASSLPQAERLGPAGVVAFDDYPASLLAVAVANALDLPGPRLEAALLCHHKLWSRLIQREVAPEAVPPFQAIHLHEPYARADIALEFPFWLKPVKSSLSHLAFRVGSMAEFEQARAAARAGLPAFAGAFNEMLDASGIRGPAGHAHVRGDWLIAEAPISGRQCTLEGYVHRGRVRIMGIVDSILLPDRPSFARFQHPSTLPIEAQRAMVAIATRLMRRIGFDGSMFNIEFFVDPRSARPMLLEINPRFCPQFSDLYAKVDGTYGHQVLVELAAGLRPGFRRRAGSYRVAASFVLRRMSDGIVTRAPSAAEVAEVEARFPGTFVDLLAEPGERLGELAQDSYSFRYALINLGAGTADELETCYRQAAAMLPYEFARPPAVAAGEDARRSGASSA